MVVALEAGGGAAVLGGGFGQRLKIAAAALGSGGGRRTCNDGINVSIVKAKGILLKQWRQCWQGRQETRCLIQGMYIGSNGKEIGVSRWWWWWWRCRYDNSVDKTRARK
jgi:hypothetical protein